MRANRKISDGPFRNKLGEMLKRKNCLFGHPKVLKTQNAQTQRVQNAKRKTHSPSKRKTQKNAKTREGGRLAVAACFDLGALLVGRRRGTRV